MLGQIEEVRPHAVDRARTTGTGEVRDLDSGPVASKQAGGIPESESSSRAIPASSRPELAEPDDRAQRHQGLTPSTLEQEPVGANIAKVA